MLEKCEMSLQGSESSEDQDQIFCEGEQNKKSRGEVEEHVERLVRCTHVLREDGCRQQFSREVIRTGRGTEHGWSKLVGPVGRHVQAEACARSGAVEGFKGKMVGHENKKGDKDRKVHA